MEPAFQADSAAATPEDAHVRQGERSRQGTELCDLLMVRWADQW
ncbi:hypothetical protein [Microbispora hainanensis]